MKPHEPFRFHDSKELLEKAHELGQSLPCQDSILPLFEVTKIAGRTVPNRMAVQPMEGFDGTASGAPGELTFRRYRRYAEGGSGLIWFEATSVSTDGRSNPRQLMLTWETLGDFQRLVEMTRSAAMECFGARGEPYLVLQLTHSGRFSAVDGKVKRKVAFFNPVFDPCPDDVQIRNDEELIEIQDRFVAAADLARQAGFDAVDIKACHGYLLNELLAAHTRTDSAFGGRFECRARLLLDIIREIRRSVPNLSLAVRLNATDGMPYPHGFGVDKTGAAGPDLSEPLQLGRLLIEAGCSVVNVTAGIPYYNPHIGRPFNRPARGARRAEVHPLCSVAAMIGWAADFQRAQPLSPVVGTGYSWLREFWPNVGAAVISQKDAAFIGLGRNAFAYPEAPRDLMNRGRLDPAKCCTACSCCTDLMRSDRIIGCVIRDQSIYKKAYATIRQ